MSSRPPKSSTGCHACRKMKKKCDEAKPECARCQKRGKPCPGYRSDDHLTFRSMNNSAMARSNKPTMLSIAPHGAQPFFIQPSTDWAQFSISRFVYHFVEAPSTAGLPGYLEFLPSMLNSADKSFQTSLLATSLAALANTSGMEQLHTESRVQYGRALQALQTSLRDKCIATDDHTLVSIMLLQKFEIITGNANMRKDPHEKATAELMRLRRPGNEKMSSRSTSLSRLVLIRQEIQAMDDHHEKPTPKRTTPVESENTAGVELRILLRDTAVACRKLGVCASTTKGTVEIQSDTPAQAWEHAKDVYYRILLWPSTLPPAWQMRACTLTDASLHLRSLNPDSRMCLFTSVQFGAVWIAYFCSQIHLCLSLLKATRSIQSQPQTATFEAGFAQSATEIAKTIHSTVDSIISSSAFLLGDVDSEGQTNATKEKRALGAFFLLRGLDVALAVPMLSAVHQQSILQLLSRIGTEFGIKIALIRRERWLAQESERLSGSLG